MAAKILIINEICNYFMLTLLKDRVINGCFMIKDRVMKGHFMTKERVIMGYLEQIRRYAGAPRVEALRQGTTLHKIIMQFKGWELARIE